MDFSNFSPALVIVTVVALALAPFVAVMVTSFTKIVVVLSLLRNALGLQQVPPNVVINGLAIVLSIYVMYPVILDTAAAVNGLPPVTTSASGTGGAQTAVPVPPGSAAPAATPPGTNQPAQTPTDAQATPPHATRAPDDPAPTSPAAADAQAAEAAAQSGAGQAEADAGRQPTEQRGPLFANVRGSPDATPAPAQAATPAPGSTAARTTVMVPARTTPISQLSLTGGEKLTMDRLLAMFEAGKEPLRRFLIQHSSDAERAFFLRSAQRLLPPASRGEITVNDFIVVIPAFTVSELTAAFQIGFLIYLPFLIIDLVVSNILLALGMMMMSPTTVSLPFKLLLFVLIDGWAKLVHGLVLTYG
jgi:type III secretory pathway component EscR